MSSPPARGSSLIPGGQQQGLIVVPARAGIFRRRAHPRRQPFRRPRPRGDLPSATVSPAASHMSSPPARGSSGHVAFRRPLPQVVPARAGIFRVRMADRRLAVGRPRPRGDLPAAGEADPTDSASSPPARGSSGRTAGPITRRYVVPARAGIFLTSRPPCASAEGRPRPRGDLPDLTITELTTWLSSPPARGSSLDLTVVFHSTYVVPARAGIFPRPRDGSGRTTRRPRPRGDLPNDTDLAPTGTTSSPPARGSSCGARWVWLWPRVVPARAGIFRRRRESRCRYRCRPRPRGDLPTILIAITANGASSPPARGSSNSGSNPQSGVAVVPARAGIFRQRRARVAAQRRRPRPRGDLPDQVGAWANVTPSSPPARGSSPGHGHLPGRPSVVPARAGIFLQRSGARSFSSSRPRPRGDLPMLDRAREAGLLSSPPARGSSDGPGESPRQGPVVPARAGIFLRQPGAW
ncbi:hypothetical protein FDG2_3305 [Candidatus Protofrankia californiensis]|uniref:Uncharacterized protein n=1 Tax=Candidatus Protofrankia californiensis TaxID=1839754 RepID=A0A1C3NZC6_9ACTN|nr:hypothetical protein FDG2_3305 [Candidatus Protofrankia californiensis]